MNRNWKFFLSTGVILASVFSLHGQVPMASARLGGGDAIVPTEAPAGTGTIIVSTNLTAATFMLTGPAKYSGSGMYITLWGVPAGVYTITYGAVPGFVTPVPQVQTLAPGATIIFTGAYGISTNTSMIQVSTNLPAATFWVTGPAVYVGQGFWWAQSNCPPGVYTVTFGIVPGYAAPPSQTLTLGVGGIITFVGTYVAQSAEAGITVATNLNAATFWLTGPQYYRGTGTWWVEPDCPPGTYTISYGDVFGYITPPSQTLTLRAGGLVAFQGNYIPESTQLNVSPLALSFSYEVGEALPAAQTISVDSGSLVTTAVATANVPWLSITPQSSKTPAVFHVSANPQGLSDGVYKGQITISGGAGYTGTTVAVSLSVQRPPYLVLTPSTLSFSYQTGTNMPPAQTLWVTATTRNIPFQYSSSGGSWLAASGNGTTPVKLSIGVNPENLAPGTYTGSIMFTSTEAFNSPTTVTVTLSINGVPPVLGPVAVFNGAYHDTRVAPCSIASIYGTSLAGTTAMSSGLPIPVTLGGSWVKVNGEFAPMFLASPGQINLQIPCDLAPGKARVEVNNGSASGFTQAQLSATGPGLFLVENWWAAAQNEDGTLNGNTNPARSGSVVVAYFTGQGPVSVAVATGQPAPQNPAAVSTAQVSATLAGKRVEPLFVGLTPGFVGLAQLNFRIPADLPTGQYPLILKLGNVTSNSAIVCVK